MDVLECVRNGWEVLDAEFGDQWPRDIDLDVFQMIKPSVCIVGQLTDGHYYEWITEHVEDENDDWEVRHGFSLGYGGPRNVVWQQLETAWRERIQAWRVGHA